MTRFELIKHIDDVYQLITFLDRYGQPCPTKANKENHTKWCRQYQGKDGCDRCKVDYWNEEVKGSEVIE